MNFSLDAPIHYVGNIRVRLGDPHASRCSFVDDGSVASYEGMTFLLRFLLSIKTPQGSARVSSSVCWPGGPWA